jgi:membrane-associated phospholipid phosphatase
MRYTMLDGLGSGLFGGLVAAPLSRWLRRYRYSTIFIVSTTLTYAYVAIASVWGLSLKVAWNRIVERGLTWVDVLGSAAIGLIAVFIVFISTAHMPSEHDKESQAAQKSKKTENLSEKK